MTSLLLKNRRITASPTTAIRGAISLSTLLGIGAFAIAQTPPSISNSVEKMVYYQKPAEGVVPAQAIAPPAPPPLLQPLTMPILQSPPPAPPPSGLGYPQLAPGQLPEVPVARQNVPTAPATTPMTTPMTTQPPIAQPLQTQTTKDQLAPPKREEVFRFDSDAVLQERIRSEAPLTKPLAGEGTKQDVYFPPVSVLATTPNVARSMPSMQVMIEPAYVVHRRLFFEAKNSERAGWDYGSAQPIVSALHFYRDCVLLPAHMASNFLEPYDTSAGKCLPGSPTPLLWYPPEITLFGGTVGAAAIVGIAAIAP